MRSKKLSTILKSWKELNQSFLKLQVKNRRTKLKKLSYTPELLIKIKQESQPVFFLSTGRCGTKFLANIFHKSFALDVYHHARPELTYIQQFAYNYPLSGEVEAVIEACRIENIVESYRRNRIYLETNNRITFLCYGARKVFPKAKFVHLIRHPGHFVRSGMRRNWYQSNTPIDMGRLIPSGSTEKWKKYSNIEKISWLWNETNQFIENFKKQGVDQTSMLTVKSEDLFKDVEQIELLAEFIGISGISKSMQKEFGKPANVQKRNDVAVYEKWSTEEKDLLKRTATLASYYDYEI